MDKSKADLVRELTIVSKERDAYKRVLDLMPDTGEKGMGGTLTDAILCHLRIFVDTKERFWELARVADAGHTRQIQHIVMRAFIRMVEEADRADKYLGLLKEIKELQTKVHPINTEHSLEAIVENLDITIGTSRGIDKILDRIDDPVKGGE